MNNVPFKGVIAYPITPFDDNEQIDIPLFKNKWNGWSPPVSTVLLH